MRTRNYCGFGGCACAEAREYIGACLFVIALGISAWLAVAGAEVVADIIASLNYTNFAGLYVYDKLRKPSDTGNN